MMGAAMVLRRCWWAPARTWLQILGYLASLVDVLPDYKSVTAGLQSFLQYLCHGIVACNVTVAAYIKRQWGTYSTCLNALRRACGIGASGTGLCP